MLVKFGHFGQFFGKGGQGAPLILPIVDLKLATVLLMRRECMGWEIVIFHTTYGLRGEVVMEVVVSETVVLHTTPGLGK